MRAPIALDSAKIAATRLTEQNIDQFRKQIVERMDVTGEQPHLVEWLRVIESGPENVKALLLDESERGRYMRSLVPLRAFISHEERREIINRVRNIVIGSP